MYSVCSCVLVDKVACIFVEEIDGCEEDGDEEERKYRCDPECGLMVVNLVLCKDVIVVLNNSCDEDGSLVGPMILVVPCADDCLGWLGKTVVVVLCVDGGFDWTGRMHVISDMRPSSENRVDRSVQVLTH